MDTSPNSSPTAISPASDDTPPPPPPPPPPSSSSNSSTTSPSPTLSQPNQTSDPPAPSTPSTPSNTSAPPPQSSPPAVPSAPPPSPPLSPPPPVAPVPTSPPPSRPTSPPPSPPTSPPPSPPTSPPPSPPSAPPPVETSPPPPNLSPPPPVKGSPPPPPQESPEPPAASPPPPKGVAPSPPPPVNDPTPPSSNSPPPPRAKPPQSSPPPPRLTPPPSESQAAPPPSTHTPPPSTHTPPPSKSSPPPASIPSSSPPNPTSPPLSTNSSVTGTPTPPPLPSFPTEKPTAKTTDPDSNISANGTSTNSKAINTGGAVAIGIIVGFVVLSVVAMAIWLVKKQKKKGAGSNVGYNMPSPYASSQNSDSSFLRPNPSVRQVGNASGSGFMYSPPEGNGMGNSRTWFTYEELSQATGGFSAENLLGEGGFGCVYRGDLLDGREVAVKQLKVGGGQGEREFRAEVEIISRVHHRHLVSLVGYCIAEHQRLLVYDYVSNDTLHYHLHAVGRPVMDWAIRLKVAAGAARGLAYLHEDCHPRIIHRDIKSSNILLDDNFEAQVADFGLAKLAGDDACTHITTRVMGTFGYMAPEYASSGKLTEKSDVYSFGVVLLELITGRKPVDGSQPLGDESLVEWARPLLAQALEDEDFEGLVDSRLEKNYVDIEMFRMIEAAAACVRHSATKRPRMGQVVRAFDSISDYSDLTNGVKPGQSGVFDSAQHSAQIRMFQRMAFGSQDYSSSFYSHSQSSYRS